VGIGEYSSITNIGLLFIFLMAGSVIFLPRRFALIPVIATCCYMTLGQQIVIATLNFSALRLILLSGWIRLFIRHEFFPLKLNQIDKLIIAWIVSSIVIYTLLWQTTGAFINRLGFAYDAIGTYFLFRFLIRDYIEIDYAIKVIAFVIFPLALEMLVEYTTGRNAFAIFGGVPEITVMRGGRMRCQGPFIHPILAGTLGATLIPLYLGTWIRKEKMRLISSLGLISSSIIMVTSSSSGPLTSAVYGIIAMLVWPFRNHLRAIRWGIVFFLVLLAIFMKAPIWYLMARLGSIIGGGGWHRSYLIDQAIHYFDEWWLLGTKVTAHWMPYALENYPTRADITNQYISEGVNGGLLTMILFILIIVFCFRGIGKTLKNTEEDSFDIRITIWSLGSVLFAHTMSLLSVSYFDQIRVFWYLLLAMIAVVTSMSNTVTDITENHKNAHSNTTKLT